MGTLYLYTELIYYVGNSLYTVLIYYVGNSLYTELIYYVGNSLYIYRANILCWELFIYRANILCWELFIYIYKKSKGYKIYTSIQRESCIYMPHLSLLIASNYTVDSTSSLYLPSPPLTCTCTCDAYHTCTIAVHGLYNSCTWPVQ